MLAIEMQITDIYESAAKMTVVKNSVVNVVNLSGSTNVSVGAFGTAGFNTSGSSTNSDPASVTVTNASNSQFTVTTSIVSTGSNVTEWATSNDFLVTGTGKETNLLRPVQLSDSLASEVDRMIHEGRIDRKAYQILAGDPELFYYTGSAYDAVTREISDLRLTGECGIKTFFDPESTRGPMLVLECRVKDVPYQELISMWKRLSLSLFQYAPKDVRKRIAFTMDRV